MRVTEHIFEILAFEAKIKGVLTDYTVAMINDQHVLTNDWAVRFIQEPMGS